MAAARGIVARHGIGEPVEVRQPASLPPALYLWLRLAWAPNVAAAKTWSCGGDAVRALRGRLGR
jgi:hypothetical protein